MQCSGHLPTGPGSAGWLDTVLPAWQHGQTVVSTQHRFDEEWAFDFMARHGVTHSFMTPTALKRLAQVAAPRERWNLATRVICTGGESLPGDVVRWADEEFGIVVNEFYGLTEFKPHGRVLQGAVPGGAGLDGDSLPRPPDRDHRRRRPRTARRDGRRDRLVAGG